MEKASVSVGQGLGPPSSSKMTSFVLHMSVYLWSSMAWFKIHLWKEWVYELALSKHGDCVCRSGFSCQAPWKKEATRERWPHLVQKPWWYYPQNWHTWSMVRLFIMQGIVEWWGRAIRNRVFLGDRSSNYGYHGSTHSSRDGHFSAMLAGQSINFHSSVGLHLVHEKSKSRAGLE